MAASTPPAPPPATYAELVAVLQRRRDALTPAQRRLADHVLADPEGTAFLTIGELAAAVGVNEATVVRFAAGLGLEGYPGLVALCRERLRRQAQLLRRFDELATLPAEEADPLAVAAETDRANIARTFAAIDRGTFDGAVRLLAEAPRVHVMGLRKCHAPAYLLGYLLRMLRDEVEILGIGPGTLAEDLRRVRAGDCFVAVSVHRYSALTVKAFHRARERGALGIALTDTPASPLSPDAEFAFHAEMAGVSVLRSVTAFTSLAQALAAAVAREGATTTRESLRVEEDLLEEFGTYLDE